MISGVNFSMVNVTRRIAAALVVASAMMLTARAETPIRITDVVGREVVLERPARRIILGAWVSLDALALIHPDPVSLLAGWAGEAGANRFQLGPMRKRFPAIDQVPIVGKDTLETMSIEAVIAAKPDIVVLSRYDAFRWASPTSNRALQQLASAGIPVAIVDFYLDPIANTETSLRLLGRILGREAQAEAFISLYKSRMDTIRTRIARAGPDTRSPSVFVHAFAARQDCCWTSGPGVGDGLTRISGGHSIGADVLTTPIGQMSLEYVLTRNPDIYVATGGQDVVPGSKFVLGRGITEEEARSGLQALAARADLSALGAIRNGRTYGIWQNFAHTPLHVVQGEVFAKWFHPDLFRDLDPRQTLERINRDFLAVPLEGTFWIDLARRPGAL
jgi:iron complex transport system substrate-binding protein